MDIDEFIKVHDKKVPRTVFWEVFRLMKRNKIKAGIREGVFRIRRTSKSGVNCVEKNIRIWKGKKDGERKRKIGRKIKHIISSIDEWFQ